MTITIWFYAQFSLKAKQKYIGRNKSSFIVQLIF